MKIKVFSVIASLVLGGIVSATTINKVKVVCGNCGTENRVMGRDFGVIGPNGRFRKCLHTVEAFEWRKEGKGTK